MKDKKEANVSDELLESMKNLNEYNEIPNKVGIEMRKCFVSSIKFDEFVNAVIKRLAENFSIPVDVLKMKFVKEPTLSEFVLRAYSEVEAIKYSIKLQVSDIMLKKFMRKHESEIRRKNSQYRYMWN